MSRPLRLEHPGAAWHITVRGNERRPIFRSDPDRRLYLALLASAAKRFRWSIRSWVLMTNHVHLVLVTPEPTLSRGMHWLNGTYARLFNLRHQRVGHLFQGRFKAILIDEQAYLHEVLRYTVLNPVRAGMVEHPADYRWSSYRALAGLEKIPEWLDAEWLLQLDKDPARCREIYRDFVAEKLTSRESIWDALVGQIYLGTAQWVDRMRRLVDAKPRSDEYPHSQRTLRRVSMPSIVRAVARASGMTAEELRRVRGSRARALAAWIGWNEGLLRLREIAAALRLRSAGYVSSLIRRCDAQLARDLSLQRIASAAIAAL
jgi:putative transposase